MSHASANYDADTTTTPAALEVIQGLGAAHGPEPAPDEVLTGSSRIFATRHPAQRELRDDVGSVSPL